jgi:SAM-dependent methyltransferase
MTLAHRNEDTFAETRTRAELDAEGWSDPGERVATLWLADRLRGGDLLDVGIGTGRTTSLLRLLTANYVGIDYVEEMVQTARLRHPGIDLRLADARDLIEFDQESFDLVTFSYNGIDAVDHDDRQLILASFRRVLRPGGYLMFSTLNADGPAALERPWRLNPPMGWHIGSLQPQGYSRSKQLAGELRHTVRSPGDRPKSVRNWLRLRRGVSSGDGWDMAPIGAHRFSLLVHLTRPVDICREMAVHGFDVESIIGSDEGKPIDGAKPSLDWWFHVIARKAPIPVNEGHRT